MGTRTRAGAEERRALVRSLYEQGLGKEEIAERVGINGRNVLGHLTALGFEQPFASQRPPPRSPKLRPTRLSEIPFDERMRAARAP